MTDVPLVRDQVYVDPNGHRWVWDDANKQMRNLSAEAPASPDQAVRDFQTRHARYRVQVFSNRSKDGTAVIEFSAPALPDVRRTLRAVLVQLLGSRDPDLSVQYNCWDFHQQKWLDPTTDPPREVTTFAGLRNTELRVLGGFGDLL